MALLLQRVVTNFGGGVHGGFDVAVFQNLPCALGVVRPNTGKAIGLQLQLDRQLVVLHLADAPALAIDLLADAQQVLHVVADFVGNHIRLRKLARRAEFVFQRLVKAEVDVDLLVGRAIKRAHCRLALAASGRGGTAKQHQLGLLVLGTALAKDIAPDIFGIGQHGGDELPHAVIRRRTLGGALLHLRWLATTQQAKDGQRIDAKNPAAQQRNNYRSDANTALASTQHSPTTAAVFDVVRGAIAFPFHVLVSWRSRV